MVRLILPSTPPSPPPLHYIHIYRLTYANSACIALPPEVQKNISRQFVIDWKQRNGNENESDGKQDEYTPQNTFKCLMIDVVLFGQTHSPRQQKRKEYSVKPTNERTSRPNTTSLCLAAFDRMSLSASFTNRRYFRFIHMECHIADDRK